MKETTKQSVREYLQSYSESLIHENIDFLELMICGYLAIIGQPTSPTLSRKKVIEIKDKVKNRIGKTQPSGFKLLTNYYPNDAKDQIDDIFQIIMSELCASNHSVDVNNMVAGEREESCESCGNPLDDCICKETEPPIQEPLYTETTAKLISDAHELAKQKAGKKEPLSKDIPPECRLCVPQNSESCNTCRVLNPQFDGV